MNYFDNRRSKFFNVSKEILIIAFISFLRSAENINNFFKERFLLFYLMPIPTGSRIYASLLLFFFLQLKS